VETLCGLHLVTHNASNKMSRFSGHQKSLEKGVIYQAPSLSKALRDVSKESV